MDVGSFGELHERAAAMSEEELDYRIREHEAAHRRRAAVNSVLIAEAERRKTYRSDGHATMYGQLRSTLHWSEGECRDATQLARFVETYPDIGAALFEASMSVANVVALAKVHANPNCTEPLESAVGGSSTSTPAAACGPGAAKRITSSTGNAAAERAPTTAARAVAATTGSVTQASR